MRIGAAKSGAALLAGLLRCARCGRKLHVSYGGLGGRVPRYHCKGAQINHGEDWCISFGGARVDERISTVVLDALAPVGIEASLAAAREVTIQDDQKREALSLAIEKARYEVALARRQYDAVDPDNRLVAAELETRWNAALERCAEMETHLANTDAERDEITEEERLRLLELGHDLNQLWNHPDASAQLRKRILRTVLEEIVVDVSDDPPEVRFRLHWAGGVHTTVTVAKNRTGQHQRSTDRNIIEVLRALAEIVADDQIARILNMLGYRSGHGNTWTAGRVRSARHYHGIPAFDRKKARPWLTLAETAAHFGVSASAIRKLLKTGVLPARQVVAHAPWMIDPHNLDAPEVVATVRAVRAGRRASRPEHDQREMPLFLTT